MHVVSITESSILLPKVYLLLKLNVGLRILDVHIDKEKNWHNDLEEQTIRKSVALRSILGKPWMLKLD